MDIFNAEDLTKTVFELRAEVEQDIPEHWFARVAVLCMTISLAHQKGDPLPWPLMQHLVNLTTAFMPDEIMQFAGNTLDYLNAQVDEILALKEHFNMPSAEEPNDR